MGKPSEVLLVGLGNIAYKYDTFESNLIGIENSYSKTHLIAAKKAGLKVIGGIDPITNSRLGFEKFSNLATWKSISEVDYNLNSCLIVVSTPAESHLSTISEILDNVIPAGIVCEKPFGISETESKAILEKTDSLRVPLLVNYTRQYSSGYTELKGCISIRNFESGYFNYNYGLTRSASHFIRLVIGILGPPQFVERGLGNQLEENPNFSLVYSNNRRVKFLGVQNSGLQVAQGVLKTNDKLITLNDGYKYEIRNLPITKTAPYWTEESVVIFSGNLAGGLDQIYQGLEWCSSNNYIDLKNINYLDSLCNQIMDQIRH
jgi:hypothetical protein